MGTSATLPVDERVSNLDSWVETMIATEKLAHAQTTIFKSGEVIH